MTDLTVTYSIDTPPHGKCSTCGAELVIWEIPVVVRVTPRRVRVCPTTIVPSDREGEVWMLSEKPCNAEAES